MSDRPELVMFHFSPYNERARWALDAKNIPHTRRVVVPGLHVHTMMLMSGQKSTPVLRSAGRNVIGSEAIVRWAEEHGTGPALTPERDAERAWEIARWFSDEVGAAARRAFFFTFWNDVDYLSRLFAFRKTEVFRKRLKPVIWTLRPILAFDMKINAKDADKGLERIDEAFAFIEEHGKNRYLVGDGFTLADLTAAALLAPLVLPPEFYVKAPEPMPPGLRARVDEWRARPGGRWVFDMYRAHRGESAEVV